MSVLQEIGAAVRAAATTVGPAVVAVGSGAGAVIAPGRVLTNAHHVRGGAGSEAAVRFADGRRAAATVRGIDADGDLAVLEVDTGDVEPLVWRDTEVALGDPVVAFGQPSRRGVDPDAPTARTRATVGFVSAADQRFRGPRGRVASGAVEHTAPLPRGSSGGPIVDLDGRFAGIDTHRRGGGFYLALPAGPALRERVDALLGGAVVDRPRLGIAVAPPEVGRRLRRAVGLDDRPGLLVRDVAPDSPADAAGLERGDLITSAAGTEVMTSDDLFGVLDDLGEGQSLSLEVVRGTETRTVAVTFGDTRTEGSA